MLSASCSMEMPAFTCRTLDWLRTSLLNGMSREGDSVIFWIAFVRSILHDGQPGASLSAFNPSRKRPRPLTLVPAVTEQNLRPRALGESRADNPQPCWPAKQLAQSHD